MTERTCSTCAHMVMSHDIEKCASPQIIAAYGGMTRTAFEADSYDKEHNRDRVETRKCGTSRLNYQRRATA